MATKIFVEASNTWDYFYKHKVELKTIMHRIAENKEYGIEVFITEDKELPSIVVTADNVQVYEESAVTEQDCKQTVKNIYETYLTDKVVATLSELDGGELLTDEEIEGIIDERECELDCAVSDFLMVVLHDYFDDLTTDYAEICDDLKEHFLEYIARKHDLPVYRPMYLEYDDGDEFEEYPYENMEFDDEDNPVYKK